MAAIDRAIREAGKGIYRSNPTIPTKSTFVADGKLTPAEFVAAGELLRSKCPQWHWCTGDKDRMQKWLPEDKQFLELKGIPCRMRAADLMGGSPEKLVGSGDDEWVETGDDIASKGSEQTSSSASPSEGDDEDDDYMDFSDESSAPTSTSTGFRTYDATIVYDIYYNSPRLFLKGYAEDGTSLLTKEQILEDMSEEHARKTATVETHPHLGVPTASIHPCKHALTMKAMVEHEMEEGRQVRPEQYFFYFLKFVSSAIPTIEIAGAVETE
ncbi:Autophagy-related protein 3 C (Atg3C) [Monocercomonoides exilis]|uniref:Autophagy-related protein 3 C (Atg3C) n=1 Tax=Monocercomonoides exilis TaxID=2049356 RepID=UPI00355A391E|nr:Autophagy-related protein 3 C (Atg3C) [Monocercomonoides exilis]|eukprot:MONOS_5451.1-p1 / transcript=MONOS_5451.1 / gene=MONOS_5451 / organism=Monocercomonoides_exilis_PA203 / gene_product=Autophagy-related protein 3 C (Atg3C) / transcript_product=Autophagy-related protein 3 C (Atg3C) / location=Mono_scaffold00158:81853-83158(-) / protein_length=269 / sequence_SO=supercontig / SO=protein_coding / is_pseudo=false